MSGANPTASAQESAPPQEFNDVPEKRWIVRPMRDESGSSTAYGTSGVLTCIGLYMQITGQHFFMAHMTNNLREYRPWLDLIQGRSSKIKPDEIREEFGKNLTQTIRKGLEEQGFEGSDKWVAKDFRQLIAESLTVCYTEEHNDPNRFAQAIVLFKGALLKWAGIKDIKYEYPLDPKKDSPSGKGSRKNGFVITHPTAESTVPVWIVGFSEKGRPVENQGLKDDKRWKGKLIDLGPDPSEEEKRKGARHPNYITLLTLCGKNWSGNEA